MEGMCLTYSLPELPLGILLRSVGVTDLFALVLADASGFVRPITAVRLLYGISAESGKTGNLFLPQRPSLTLELGINAPI